MKKKVLMLTATLGYGGSESDFLRLARYLSRYADITIALMARDYGTKHYSSAQSNSEFPVVILDGEVQPSMSLWGKLRRWRRMLLSLKALKNNHDATVSFLSGPNFLNALAFSSGMTVVSERGSKRYHCGLSSKTKFLWLHLLDPITYRFVDKVVAVSRAYMEEVKVVAGKSQIHKVCAIEGSIDAENILAMCQEPPDKDIEDFVNEKTLVFCSRLDIGKGIDLLLPIVAKLLREHCDLKLLILGDGPLKGRLVEICRSYQMSYTNDGDPHASIFFAGYRETPMRHFRYCRAYCFPSLHEGLSNALMEGVASGVPVVAADCPWGVKTILGGEDNQDYDFPARLPYGTLLPMINTPAGQKLWFESLKQLLVDDKLSSADIEQMKQSIRRFDIKQTGPLWSEMLALNE